jgi:hypothetical protein
MRRTCRSSCENGVDRNAVTIAAASFSVCIRAPMPITLASLCSRASRATSTLQASAPRTPGTLFAAICSPLPEPPITTPRLPGSATTRVPVWKQNTG